MILCHRVHTNVLYRLILSLSFLERDRDRDRERERERERMSREGWGRGREDLKQALCPAWSPVQGSIMT